MIEDKQSEYLAGLGLETIRRVQRLDYESRQLEDERTISDYNITASSTIFEEGRLCGGARNPEITEDNIESIETQSN